MCEHASYYYSEMEGTMGKTDREREGKTEQIHVSPLIKKWKKDSRLLSYGVNVTLSVIVGKRVLLL